MGLALAEILTQKGAHVSIVARNKENLDKALAKLEVANVLKYNSHDLSLIFCRNYASPHLKNLAPIRILWIQRLVLLKLYRTCVDHSAESVQMLFLLVLEALGQSFLWRRPSRN